MERVIGLSIVLGVSSFVIGILPLSFTFSRRRLNELSTFGNGLLLGAALGVIIPEGMETLSSAQGSSSSSQTALSLLVGFSFMLVVEQYLVSHQPPRISPHHSREASELLGLPESTREFDVNSIDNEEPAVSPMFESTRGSTSPHRGPIAHPLTLGLVLHSLTDGLALGASAAGEEGSDMGLSLVVFLALIIHKSPTALALTTSLLSSSMPRSEIKKHVLVFSSATPLGAILSYILLHSIGTHIGDWTGIALLASGGTFLYVATVIQPLGTHSHEYGDPPDMDEPSKLGRVVLLVAGIFLPFAIGALVGGGHSHGHARTH